MRNAFTHSALSDIEIDARETQVTENPRILPLESEQFSEDAKRLVAETFAHREQKDKSEIPPIFRTMVKHPALFRNQVQFGTELATTGFLSPRERELAVLRVAWLSRAPFEWGEHVVYGKNSGLSDEEVERITQGSEAPDWSDHDRAILRAVEELMADYAISTPTWDILASSWSDPQLMELTGVVGYYLMTAMVFNSLRFEKLEGNIGLRAR